MKTRLSTIVESLALASVLAGASGCSSLGKYELVLAPYEQTSEGKNITETIGPSFKFQKKKEYRK